ncbi:Ldh family oxidoreductase [Micromonospora zingiberis]|uniref:Ldh family oxidoreductase n=1 Tax=Micromonospora zingiberis TaxID=2053011 RepID=UPI0013F47DAA
MRVPADRLVEYVTACYLQRGLPVAAARTVAQMQVDTDRRGVLSHGTRKVASYLAKLADGSLNPRPRIRAVEGAGVCLRLDADRAVGPWAAAVAVRRAVRLAAVGGAAVVAAVRCGHIGAAGSSALLGAQAGMVTIVLGQTGSASVAPHGTNLAVLGTIPLAIATPNSDRPPVLVDCATASTSWGTLARTYRDADRPLPEGWAYDGNGDPTQDPHQAAVLRTLGEKGSALAAVAAVLVGPLTGASALPSTEGRGLLTITVSPAVLGVAGQFGDKVEQLAEAIRTARPAPGSYGARMPGDRAWAAVAETERDGIGLDPAHLESLLDAGRGQGVDLRLLTDHLIGTT